MRGAYPHLVSSSTAPPPPRPLLLGPARPGGVENHLCDRVRRGLRAWAGVASPIFAMIENPEGQNPPGLHVGQARVPAPPEPNPRQHRRLPPNWNDHPLVVAAFVPMRYWRDDVREQVRDGLACFQAALLVLRQLLPWLTVDQVNEILALCRPDEAGGVTARIAAVVLEHINRRWGRGDHALCSVYVLEGAQVRVLVQGPGPAGLVLELGPDPHWAPVMRQRRAGEVVGGAAVRAVVPVEGAAPRAPGDAAVVARPERQAPAVRNPRPPRPPPPPLPPPYGQNRLPRARYVDGLVLPGVEAAVQARAARQPIRGGDPGFRVDPRNRLEEFWARFIQGCGVYRELSPSLAGAMLGEADIFYALRGEPGLDRGLNSHGGYLPGEVIFFDTDRGTYRLDEFADNGISVFYRLTAVNLKLGSFLYRVFPNYTMRLRSMHLAARERIYPRLEEFIAPTMEGSVRLAYQVYRAVAAEHEKGLLGTALQDELSLQERSGVEPHDVVRSLREGFSKFQACGLDVPAYATP